MSVVLRELQAAESAELAKLHPLRASGSSTSSVASSAGTVLMDVRGHQQNFRSLAPNVAPKGTTLDDKCATDKHALQNMLDEAMWYEYVFMAATIVVGIVAIGTTCFILGQRVKPRPPSYWRTWTFNRFSDSFASEVDVTAELRAPVQRLLDWTTKPELMGKGRDGSWATHKSFRVLKVTRIENGRLWSKFARIRDSITRVDKLLAEMQPVWNQHAENALVVVDEAHAEREADPLIGFFLRSLGLDTSRNERLLFHGSPAAGARNSEGEVLFPTDECSPAFAIKHEGFDDRLGSTKGMYGAGTYFANMASKADQYAGRYNLPNSPEGSIGEQATMFLARVVLGCPYLTDQSLEQLRRPPCIDGHFDMNLFWNEDVKFGRSWREKGLPLRICEHPRFDSVIGDYMVDQKKRLFREYVVYEQQCYPEFCVLYERLA